MLTGDERRLTLRCPAMYQEINGQRSHVAGGYLLRRGNEVRFRIGAYDHTRPLVIDPVLVYSTYLGGSVGGPRIRHRR